MSDFDALVERFLDDAFALDPVSATAIGRHDGETPGFSYRAHLEAVISTGKLPLPLLRRAILPD